MRTLNQAISEVTEQVEPIVRVSIAWGGAVGTRRYSTRAGGIWHGKILSISGITSTLKQQSVGTVSTVSITLDDADGTLKEAVDFTNPEGKVCNVYVYYNGIPGSHTHMFRGKLTNPIEWSESDRSLTVNALSDIESDEVGFTILENQFGVNNDVAVGKVWPLVFGKPAHVPAILAQRQPTSEIIYPVSMAGVRDDQEIYELSNDRSVHSITDYLNIELTNRRELETYLSSGIDDESVTITRMNKIYLKDGSGFPQDEVIDVIIDGVVFRGTMQGNVFSIEEGNVAKWENVTFTERDNTDQDFNNPLVAWLEDNTIDLINHYCYFHAQAGVGFADNQKWKLRKCVRQVGRKVWFDKPFIANSNTLEYKYLAAGNSISEVRAIPLNGMIVELNEFFAKVKELSEKRADMLKDTEKNPYGALIHHLELIKYIKNAYWNRPVGTEIRQWGANPDVYIANAVPSEHVHAVYGTRTFEGKDYFVPIPKSYYTVNKNHETNIPNIPNVTTISFIRPLSTYKGQGWSDDIYVTVTSSLPGNSAYAIQYLIDNYTNLVSDNDSFNDVASGLSDCPANFAITSKWDAIKLAESIAYQSRCALTVDGDDLFIHNLSVEPTASYVIDEDHVELHTATTAFTESFDIYTKYVGKWKASYQPALEGTVDLLREAFFENNFNLYGVKLLEEDFFIYNDHSLVQKSLDFWGYRYSNVWKKFRCTCFHGATKLEMYDGVIVQFNDTSILRTVSVKGIVEGITLNLHEGTVDLDIWLPIRAGTFGADSSYWNNNQNVNYKDPTTDLKEVDYDVRLPEDGLDADGIINKLKQLATKYKQEAKIKSPDTEYLDAWLIDIYGNGLDSGPTEVDVKAFLTAPSMQLYRNAEVTVETDDSGINYISGKVERKLYARITGLGDEAGTYTATQVRANGAAIDPALAIVWDGESGNYPPLHLQDGGCGPAVYKIVEVKHDVDDEGNEYWFFYNDAPFPAMITGNTEHGSNSWKYNWIECARDGGSPGGGTPRTGDLTTKYALNQLEYGHDATYAFGMDVTASDYPAGAGPRPVGSAGNDTTHKYNVIVDMYEIVKNGDLEYHFSAPGSHDGPCEALPEE